MAIAFDAATNGGALAASPKTFSHTVTGSNPFLWVVARHTSATDTVTSITYNGVAMTKAVFQPTNGSVHYYSQSLWYLMNPSTGSNTVSITTSSGNVTGFAMSYTGVQGGYDASSNGAVTSTTTMTGSITTVADNCWAVMAISEGDGAASASTNFTARISATSEMFGDSNAAITPAGSYNMTVTWGSTQNGGYVMGSMSPTGASGPTTVKTWDGVTQSTGVKTYMDVAIASVKTVNGAT